VLSDILIILTISIYLFSLLWISLFSFGQLHLAWIYARKKGQKTSKPASVNEWPNVTVQLPLYNERYVVERLLKSMAQLDYPAEKLTIQILDDSTDDTTAIIQRFLQTQSGSSINFQHIRREVRTGFKAGALAYGMQLTQDQFIAIFDADFLPPSDFLRNAIPHFDNENIGMVQAKWKHLNEDYSLLTKMQAFGLNAHFSVEQMGRNLSGSFMNFNGTGGIWLRDCIEEAGGWNDDTLTEDLDLSYRAQLKGWKFKFVESLACPGELPVMIPAIKSQQYRWNKGAAESARKHLPGILKSDLGHKIKIRAVLHLLNSSVFVFLLIAAILSIPMLYIKANNPGLALIFQMGSIFLSGFVAIGIFYWISTKANVAKPAQKSYFARSFPLFMIFSMGLSLHNSIAIIEGWMGKKTPFIRTPKFNITEKGQNWNQNQYLGSLRKVQPSLVTELLLAFYFSFGVGYGLHIHDWGLLLWHGFLAIGFYAMSLLSILSLRHGATA
jgi:cellulose synthase/poly-beta-1,6-N-acetylglucosamine synthase-like glycosyltransferase